MSKKQTLSKTELQEMTGLDFSEQNSQIEERVERRVLMPHWRISLLKTSSHFLYHQ